MAIPSRAFIVGIIVLFLCFGPSSTQEDTGQALEKPDDPSKHDSDDLQTLRTVSDYLSEMSNVSTEIRELLDSAPRHVDVIVSDGVTTEDTAGPRRLRKSGFNSQEDEEEESSQIIDPDDKELANRRQKRLFGRVLGAGYKIGRRDWKEDTGQQKSSLSPPNIDKSKKSQSQQPRFSPTPSQNPREKRKAAAASSHGAKKIKKRLFGRLLGGGYKIGKRQFFSPRGNLNGPVSAKYPGYQIQRIRNVIPLESISSAGAVASSAVTNESFLSNTPPSPPPHPPFFVSSQGERLMRSVLHRLRAITPVADTDTMDKNSVDPRLLFPDQKEIREELEVGQQKNYQEDADGIHSLPEDDETFLTNSPTTPAWDGESTAVRNLLAGPRPGAEEMAGPERILRCILEIETLNDGCRPPGCLSQQLILMEKEYCRQRAGVIRPAAESEFSPGFLSQRILYSDPSSPPSTSLSLASPSRVGYFHEKKARTGVSEDITDLFQKTVRSVTENKEKVMAPRIKDLMGSSRSASEKGNPLFQRSGMNVDSSPSRSDRGLGGVLGKKYKSGNNQERSFQDEFSTLYKRWFFASKLPRKSTLGRTKRGMSGEMLSTREDSKTAQSVTSGKLEPSVVLANLEQHLSRLRAAINELGYEQRYIWKNPRGYSTVKRNFDIDDPLVGRGFLPSSGPRGGLWKSIGDLLLSKRAPSVDITPFVGRRFEPYSLQVMATLPEAYPQGGIWKSLGDRYLAKRGYSTPLVDRRFEGYPPQLMATLPGFDPHGGIWKSLGDLYVAKRGQSPRDIAAPIVGRRFETDSPQLTVSLPGPDHQGNIWKSLGNLYLSKRGLFSGGIVDRRFEARASQLMATSPDAYQDFWTALGMFYPGKRSQPEQPTGLDDRRPAEPKQNVTPALTAEVEPKKTKRFFSKVLGGSKTTASSGNKRRKPVLSKLLVGYRFGDRHEGFSLRNLKPRKRAFGNGFSRRLGAMADGTSNSSRDPSQGSGLYKRTSLRVIGGYEVPKPRGKRSTKRAGVTSVKQRGNPAEIVSNRLDRNIALSNRLWGEVSGKHKLDKRHLPTTPVSTDANAGPINADMEVDLRKRKFGMVLGGYKLRKRQQIVDSSHKDKKVKMENADWIKELFERLFGKPPASYKLRKRQLPEPMSTLDDTSKTDTLDRHKDSTQPSLENVLATGYQTGKRPSSELIPTSTPNLKANAENENFNRNPASQKRFLGKIFGGYKIGNRQLSALLDQINTQQDKSQISERNTEFSKRLWGRVLGEGHELGKGRERVAAPSDEDDQAELERLDLNRELKRFRPNLNPVNKDSDTTTGTQLLPLLQQSPSAIAARAAAGLGADQKSNS